MEISFIMFKDIFILLEQIPHFHYSPPIWLL